MKKILSLIIVLLLISGCNEKHSLNNKQNNDSNNSSESKEKEEIVTTAIITNSTIIEIEDNKITIPIFKKVITNKITNETKDEEIDIKDLKFLNSKNKELKIEDNNLILENTSDTITVIYIEKGQEFKTTFKVKAKEKFIKFGSSTLYFGKYKAEGDLPSSFNGTITIKRDGTCTYIGSKYNNGSISKVNLTGTWEVKAKSISGLQGSPDNPTKVDGIAFSWSDNSTDSYGISTKYFGNQFMGYKWISE